MLSAVVSDKRKPIGKKALRHCTTAGSTPPHLDHESFAVFCPLALLGSAFYPVLVHRLAASLHASSPNSVALMQLRSASFAVINLRRELHPQECAYAGRIKNQPRTLGFLSFGGARQNRTIRKMNAYGKNCCGATV